MVLGSAGALKKQSKNDMQTIDKRYENGKKGKRQNTKNDRKKR